MAVTPENLPQQPGQGFTPEQQQQLAALLELGLSGLVAQPDDEGVTLAGVYSAIRDETKRGHEVTGERLKELEGAFDVGMSADVDGILKNYERLYYPSEWELESQLKNIAQVRTGLERRIKTFENKEVGEGSETLQALRRMHKKVLWGEGIETVLAGGMISTATYYAGEERLKNIPKLKITAVHNQAAYSEKLEGIEAEGIIEGTLNRERIIQMQDTAMDVSIMAAMGLQQRMVEQTISQTPSTAPREREKMYLDPKTLKLMEEVFAARDGEGNIIRVDWIDPETKQKHEGVPADTINYFCLMDNTERGKRTYVTLLTAMVYLNATDQLAKGEKTPEQIGLEVRTEAERLRNNYFSPDMFKDTDERFAHLIARATIAKHLGDMSSGDVGWGWTHEVAAWEDLEDVEKEMFAKCDVAFSELSPAQQAKFRETWSNEAKAGKKWAQRPEDMRFVVVRVSELGSIYNADDTPSPFYPERYVEEYQARAESAAEVHKGLADSFRRLIRYYPPDWCPPLDKFAKNNPYVMQMVEFLLNDKYANVPERRGGKPYGNMDYRILNYMKKYARAWPTWVTVSVPEQKGPDGKTIPAHDEPYAFPMFYPPYWYSLNFWRSIGDGGKKAADVPSQWERLMERNKLSKIDFTKYSDQVVDWENVNRAQLARVLVVLYLSNKFSSDGNNAYGNFVARPLDINTLKDVDKRIARLGVRGEDVIAGITGMLTFVPPAVKLIAEQSGVGSLGDPSLNGNQAERKRAYKKYQTAISKMKLNAAYLAKSKGLSKTALRRFNTTYAAVIDFYAKLEMDWQLKAVAQTYGDEVNEEVPFGDAMDYILRMNRTNSPFA